jgi:hypothetical protein
MHGGNLKLWDIFLITIILKLPNFDIYRAERIHRTDSIQPS